MIFPSLTVPTVSGPKSRWAAGFSGFPLLLAIFVAGGILPEHSRAADPNAFEVFSYDLRNDGTIELPGRLYVPENQAGGEPLPIVLYLHGQGERGNNNTSQVSTADVTNLLAAAEANGFFLYAPQLAAGANAWNINSLDNAMRMVSNAAREYNVDLSRIAIVGYSLGGGGAWTTASRYSEVLAAVVPIAGTAGALMDFEGMVDLPLWAHHARNDGVVGVSTTRNQINSIRAADGLPPLTFPLIGDETTNFYHEENGLRVTERATGGHGIAVAVTGSSAVITWMLDQTRPIEMTTLQAEERILVDFGNLRPTYNANAGVQANIPDSGGRYWNSSAVYQASTPGAVIPFADTETGRMTSVSIDVGAAFNWHDENGLTEGSPFDAGIGSDGWTTVANTTGTLLIRGLTPGAEYEIGLYASNSSSDGGRGRMTRYQIGDLHQDLQVHNNLDTLIRFDSVAADAQGWIEILVMPTPGSTSRYGQINALTLSLVPEPGVAGCLVLAGAVFLTRRRRGAARSRAGRRERFPET